MKLENRKLLWDASTVTAPDFPRQSSSARTVQDTREGRADFVMSLEGAVENEMPGYYSVYSFPDGHSKEGQIPKVDCIFIDLDVKGDDYNPNEGKTGFDAWKREMSALLARARMIATTIIDAGVEDYFRVSLSGSKGVHLYLDFPPIHPANGTINQFKNGLESYGETVMEWLDTVAGGVNIDPWVDVDASDLGRLARHPNTRHHGAAYDDEDRWCVPITVDELATLHWEDYLEYTTTPREVPDDGRRQPSERAGWIVTQYIRTASGGNRSTGSRSTYDPQAVRNYADRANDAIELEDIPILTGNKPCIWAFRERSDAYDHGEASRTMELSIMSRLIEHNVPRDVIHEFFEEIPGYDEDWTDEELDDLIGRQYHEFNCETVLSRSSQFCLGDIGDQPHPDEGCGVYQREADLEK